ncbi:MAG: MlaE family ABC transporter permease [Gammaproteobacteria bacterium]
MSIRLLENVGMGLFVFRDCVRLYREILFGRNRLDMKVFVDDLRETGLSILPGVTLVAIVVGMIVGKETENILNTINIPGLLIGTIGLAIVSEFAPLLVGLFVAGRSGVALAVRIGSMVLNHEIDGLVVSGINPIQYTVGPMLLAMLVMSFALAVWTDLVVIGVTAAWLRLQVGISWSLFLDGFISILEINDVLVSVVKPMVFSVFIALIAAVNGSRVARKVDAVSNAATRTMVSGIAAILLINLLFVLGT